MTIFRTTDQILALAPDAASAKAGKGLASARSWVTAGRTEQALWGECQGSGDQPYRTQIDLNGPAFKCSCPSRKFPCKHGLGLFLLSVGDASAFKQTDPPPWVTQWLESRAEKAEKKVEKVQQKAAEAPPDPAAQAKRVAQREAKVSAGIAELELWVRDRVRQGLAGVQGASHDFWDTPARRLVDAQAPGLARRVRDMAGTAASGDGRQERLLAEFAKLHLLIEGFKRLEHLPPATQADVRALIGWTLSQDELLASEGVRDRWVVVGQRVEEEDRLRVQRTWLQGETSGRPALILSFSAHSSQPLDKSLVPSTRIDAELVFFPGTLPLRALVKARHGDVLPFTSLPGFDSFGEAVSAYSHALAENPWISLFPMPLRSVVPARVGEIGCLRDRDGLLAPLPARFEHDRRLWAISGGRPVDLFGEWNGETLRPLAVWAEGRFSSL